VTDPTPSTTPPRSSKALESTIVGTYLLGEAQILGGVTAILRRTPATLAGQQAAIPKIRRLVRQVVARLIYTSNDMVRQMVTAAVTEGARDAGVSTSQQLALATASVRAGGAGGGSGTLPALSAGNNDFFNFSTPHGERAAEAVRHDITSELADVRFRITRLPDDIYKAIAPHGAIGQVIDNGFTPAQAQAVAWRVFSENGVTGFTDKSGRDWSLSSYVEMAVRTASARAYNASHLARMNALGIHYFTVTDSGHPCPLCYPWQGKVLTDGLVSEPGMHVDATIDEATAAGLFHPNCRHTLVAVFPGITVLPEQTPWNPDLQAAYNSTQKQRSLEVAVRKAKRAEMYATDPAVAKQAHQDLLDAQQKLRDLVASTDQLRQSRREQVNLANARIKLPTAV
jgi:hypothetical protein